MTGQRIYYVPPRSVGSLRTWSGKDRADATSWIIDHAADMNFNAIWFSPLMTTTRVEKFHGKKKLTGSLYAIRDHFMLDPEFSSSGLTEHDGLSEKERQRIALMDISHLQHFCTKAAEKGIRVYGDLVFNHVAVDHALVIEERKKIEGILLRCAGIYEILCADNGNIIGMSYNEAGEEKTLHFKFSRNADLGLQIDGPIEDPWSDVAQINFSSPEAQRFFVMGDTMEMGYFKKIIDWQLKCGFKGFRCDVAYKIPPEVWQEVISYAHKKQPDVMFLAETLGGDPAKVQRLGKARIKDKQDKDRPAFDNGMLGFHWWDYKQDWLPKGEHPRTLEMSKFGGAASPDNHDTETTLAGAFAKASFSKKDSATACIRDYMISALAGSAVYMQMGYEYGNEKQNSVFKGDVTEEERKDFGKKYAFDITRKIREVNDLKKDLSVDNCTVNFKDYGALGDTGLLKLHCEYIDVDTGKKTAEVVLVINKCPEAGAIKFADAAIEALEKSGLQKLGDAAIADILVFHTPFNDIPAYKPVATARTKKINF